MSASFFCTSPMYHNVLSFTEYYCSINLFVLDMLNVSFLLSNCTASIVSVYFY